MWVMHDIPRFMEQIQDNGILLISFQDDVRSGKLISKFKDMSILKIIIPRISRKQHWSVLVVVIRTGYSVSGQRMSSPAKVPGKTSS